MGSREGPPTNGIMMPEPKQIIKEICTDNTKLSVGLSLCSVGVGPGFWVSGQGRPSDCDLSLHANGNG